MKILKLFNCLSATAERGLVQRSLVQRSSVRGLERSQVRCVSHCGQATASNVIDILLFDLDGTLYDADNGYVSHIRKNIFEFMYLKGFVSREESAEAIWKPLFKKYNQSRRGFKEAGYVFDDHEYWKFHRSGVEKYLFQDHTLRDNLIALPQTKKYIFTNCNEEQALEALKCLGISDCFEGIYGASFMGDCCKPERSSFELIMNHLGVEDPSRVCIFEDSYKNLVAAKKIGMTTIFVESSTALEEGVSLEDIEAVNAVIQSLSDGEVLNRLKSTVPALFRSPTDSI